MYDNEEKRHADSFAVPGAAYLHAEMRNDQCQMVITGGLHEVANAAALMILFEAHRAGVDPRDLALETFNDLRRAMDSEVRVRETSDAQEEDSPEVDENGIPYTDAPDIAVDNDAGDAKPVSVEEYMKRYADNGIDDDSIPTILF